MVLKYNQDKPCEKRLLNSRFIFVQTTLYGSEWDIDSYEARYEYLQSHTKVLDYIQRVLLTAIVAQHSTPQRDSYRSKIMQINQARQKAQKYIDDHIQISQAIRPNREERVMVRFPKDNSPTVIKAADTESLREKLAKRIQTQARRKSH